MSGKTKETITIFGGTGDLSYRKLLPALFNLYVNQELSEDVQIVAIGRRDYSQEAYGKIIQSWIETYARVHVSDECMASFLEHVHYFQMDFTDLSQYALLDDYYASMQGSNNIVYLAVAPSFFDVIQTGMRTVKHLSKPKIILEKPFGENLEQARLLNRHLEECFGKENIYRIDHYLGKEMVRNILTIRKGNLLLRNAWDCKSIERVEISCLEEVGVETRGNYYDHVGAMKDMVQNHLLQILSIVALEDVDGVVKQEQLKILQALKKMDVDSIVLGQYEGYREEEKVAVDSNTETFVAMKLFVENERWKDVPFLIRTGKKMSKREIEVRILFKAVDGYEADVLVIKIQPVEGIYLEFNIKTPGGDGVSRAKMEFCQNCNLVYRMNTPEAYERMLLACFEEDRAWFTDWELIEASWLYMLDVEKKLRDVKVLTYPVGTDGPCSFFDLL